MIICYYWQLFVIIVLIIVLIIFFIIVIICFWNQLFAIIGRDARPFHASGRQHIHASCTGARLSSVWPDHLGSRPNWMRKSSSQGTRMASANAIIGLIFPIIAIIVRFCVAAWLNLRDADHEIMTVRKRANHRSGRAIYGICNQGCTHVNSCPISLIIANYCDYLNNYCDYLETQYCDLGGPGPHSNHASSGTTKSPCSIATSW